MTFGFPAYHEEELELPAGVDAASLMGVLASLGWSGSVAGDGSWQGSVDMNLSSWGERIRIRFFGPSRVHVRSACVMPTQCFDWGRNRRNVERLREALYPPPKTF